MKYDDTNGFTLPIPTIEAISTLLDEKLSGLTILKESHSEGQDEYLDTEGVQLLLGGGNGKKVCKSTVNNWRRSGILKAYKLGPGRNTIVRFKKSEVLQAMESMEV